MKEDQGIKPGNAPSNISTTDNDNHKDFELLIRQVEDIENKLGKFEDGSCFNWVLIALRDKRVQQHFIRHIQNSQAFKHAYCLGGYNIPEEERLIFEFLCVPPRFCLLPERFLVRLNKITRKVEEVMDPAPYLVPVSSEMPDTMFKLF